MKKIIYILAFFILASCNYFEKKKIAVSDTLIEQKLQEINRSQIDKYPIFEACENIDNDMLSEKECFTTRLSDHISEYLAQQDIVLTEALQDTLKIQLQVNYKGIISIQNYHVSEPVLTAIPNVRMLISESIQQLETIKPAYKKLPETGELIPVTTQFIIPIIISE